MFYAEKFQQFKEKIQNTTKSDDKFAQLIGIELYDYIQETKELKSEFDRRLNYLKNLAEDKDFGLFQDQLFDAVQNILKLTSLEEVQQKQTGWGNAVSNYFQTKKKSEDGREDIWLTLPEIYLMAKEKKNYYRLGKGSELHYLRGEISRNVYVLPVRDQYEVNIGQLFKVVFFNKYLNDKKGQKKFEQLDNIYNKCWYKLDELMYRIPIRLHISSFEQFQLDCAMFHQREGYELFYSPSSARFEQEFKKIKENTVSVINDLLEALEIGKEEALRQNNTLKSTADSTPEVFEISVKDREVWVNDYLISRPHAVGENLEFFEYVRSKSANTKIEWTAIPDNVGYEMLKQAIKNRRFVKILNALGFKGEITKAFFYKVGTKCLYYRGDRVNKQDLKTIGVKISVFLKELELAHTKLVPNSPI